MQPEDGVEEGVEKVSCGEEVKGEFVPLAQVEDSGEFKICHVPSGLSRTAPPGMLRTEESPVLRVFTSSRGENILPASSAMEQRRVSNSGGNKWYGTPGAGAPTSD